MSEVKAGFRWVEYGLSAVALGLAGYMAVGLNTIRKGPEQLLTMPRYWRNAEILGVFGVVMIVLGFMAWRRRGRLAGARLLLGLLAVMLAGADAYVLAYRFDTSGPGGALNLTNTRWMDTYLGAVRPDPAGRALTNEAKFWERSLAPYWAMAPEDRYLIAAIGDSFTFGQGVLDRSDRFTERLQALLQQKYGSKVEVLNFGWGNGDTKTETTWIRDSVSKVHPDMVAIFYLANDIEDLGFFASPPGYPLGKTVTTMLIASPAFNLSFWRLAGPRIYAGMGNAYFHNLLMAYVNEERMQAHLTDIGTQVDAAAALGAKPVFVILPFPHLWQTVSKESQKKVYDRIGGAAASHGAVVINLSGIEGEMTPDEFQQNPIDGHPNARAHALIATRVYEGLLAQPELAAALAAGSGAARSATPSKD